MSIIECFRVAMRGLTSNKMRTALTMLGIIIGVGVVILVVAIGEGASQRIKDTVDSLGTNLLTVQANRFRVKLNAATLSYVKLNLGLSYATLDNWPKAKQEYDLALKTAPKSEIGGGNYHIQDATKKRANPALEKALAYLDKALSTAK